MAEPRVKVTDNGCNFDTILQTSYHVHKTRPAIECNLSNSQQWYFIFRFPTYKRGPLGARNPSWVSVSPLFKPQLRHLISGDNVHLIELIQDQQGLKIINKCWLWCFRTCKKGSQLLLNLPVHLHRQCFCSMENSLAVGGGPWEDFRRHRKTTLNNVAHGWTWPALPTVILFKSFLLEDVTVWCCYVWSISPAVC